MMQKISLGIQSPHPIVKRWIYVTAREVSGCFLSVRGIVYDI